MRVKYDTYCTGVGVWHGHESLTFQTSCNGCASNKCVLVDLATSPLISRGLQIGGILLIPFEGGALSLDSKNKNTANDILSTRNGSRGGVASKGRRSVA